MIRLVCTRVYVECRILHRVQELHFCPTGLNPRSQRGQGPTHTLQAEDAGAFPVFVEDLTDAVGSLLVVQLWCLLFSLSYLAVTSCSSSSISENFA